MEYFFILGGAKKGPYNKEAIKKFVAEGVITRETVIAFPDGREIPAGKLKLEFSDPECLSPQEDQRIDLSGCFFWGVACLFFIVLAFLVSAFIPRGAFVNGEGIFISIIVSFGLTVVFFMPLRLLLRIARELEKQTQILLRNQADKTDAGDSSGTKK